MTVTKVEGKKILKEWCELVKNALADAGEKVHILPKDYKFEQVHEDEDICHIFEVGDCVLYLALRESGFDSRWTPVLVASEKVRRKQKHGVGHSRDYAPTQSGAPSVPKAITNVQNRNKEINHMTKPNVPKDTPPSILVTPLENGNSVVHIGMLEVTPKKLSSLVKALNG